MKLNNQGHNFAMDIFLGFLWAFLIGGAICTLGQVLILTTKWTSARILVAFVSLGVLLGAVGAFGPMRDFAGAGVTVPIVGFGGVLAEGAIKAVERDGFIGIFMGGLAATAAGIAAAIVFGFVVAMIFKSRAKG